MKCIPKCSYPPLEYDEIGIIILAFFRRIVLDASGPAIIDNLTTETDQIEARSYLINECLLQKGYYIYEGWTTNLKRVYDSKNIKFIETKEFQKSPITLKDITRYGNLDHVAVKERIMDWEKSGWDRSHPFFQSVIKATKHLTLD